MKNAICVGSFSAPLFENASNIQQTTEACCNFVFLTNLRKVKNYRTYQTGHTFVESCDYSFNLHVIRKGDLGTNNYNEIPYAIAMEGMRKFTNLLQTV